MKKKTFLTFLLNRLNFNRVPWLDGQSVDFQLKIMGSNSRSIRKYFSFANLYHRHLTTSIVF